MPPPSVEFEIVSLARLALWVLDAQRKYFKSRDKLDLIASKELEAQLRTEAENVLTQYVKD